MEPADIGEIVARRRLRLGGDPEGPPQEVKVVDVGRAEIGAERLVDLGRLDPEHLRPVAVDLGLDPRGAGVEQGKDLTDIRVVLGGAPGGDTQPVAPRTAEDAKPASVDDGLDPKEAKRVEAQRKLALMQRLPSELKLRVAKREISLEDAMREAGIEPE